MPAESLEHKEDGDKRPTTNSQSRPLVTGPTWDKIARLISCHSVVHPRRHCQRCQFEGLVALLMHIHKCHLNINSIIQIISLFCITQAYDFVFIIDCMGHFSILLTDRLSDERRVVHNCV